MSNPEPTPQPDPQPATTNTGVANTGNVGITPGYTVGTTAGGTIAPAPPVVDEKKIAAAAKKQAAADMAAELGCTVEEAKKILGQVKAAGDAQKSETQRLHDDAVAKNAQADQVLAAAAADRLALKVERKLLAAGVPEGSLTRIAQTVTVPVDADDDTIDAEIETLRAELPSLFGPTAPGQVAPPAPAPGVTPPRPPSSTSAGESEFEAGERWAAERYPNLHTTRSN